MAYIFLDESGQFKKKNGGKYFLLVSFLTNNPRETEKLFRKWHKEKFPRKMRNQSEIKFSQSSIDDNLKIKTVDFISKLNIRIRYAFLLKSNIPLDYQAKNKIKEGLLYVHIIGELIKSYLPIEDKEIRVFCDQRQLKSIKRSDFKSNLISSIRPIVSRDTVIQIEMIDSTSNANIQIADWIAGSIASYYENKKNGEKLYLLLKNSIIGELEVFKDNWEVKNENKKSN